MYDFHWEYTLYNVLYTAIQLLCSTSVHCLPTNGTDYWPGFLGNDQITHVLPRPSRRATTEGISALLFDTNVGHYMIAQHLGMRCSDNTHIYI
jgi:hypothetical protein